MQYINTEDETYRDGTNICGIEHENQAPCAKQASMIAERRNSKLTAKQ